MSAATPGLDGAPLDPTRQPARRWRFCFLGLSITSSWGNGHATTYRALLRALAKRGHGLLFLERDLPWYAANRDLPAPPFCRTELYGSLDELEARYAGAVRDADVVVVGSYVPDGIAVGSWVQRIARGITVFYDIDTPVTVRRLEAADCEYLTPELARRYQLYLSFTGGPLLERLTNLHGAHARPLYCAVDAGFYRPSRQPRRWDLAYLGTYSADRQPALERLLLEPAQRRPALRGCVAGPQYPDSIVWPDNVERLTHVAPGDHPAFYGAQRFAVNLTRADMISAGWSPSVRLFEAAACGVPIISDAWPGLDSFFTPGREILISRSAEETLAIVDGLSEGERDAIGARARARVLREHAAAHRAVALEGYLRSTGGLMAHHRSSEREATWPRSLSQAVPDSSDRT
jgi:spore maturation protein CgeB